MATSSVPAAKAALLALIQARPGLATLQTASSITWAHPDKSLRAESVWLGDADFEDERIAAIKAVPHVKDELYALPVFVLVLNEGDVPYGSVAQAAETRWWAIVGEIEDAVRASPSLGVSNVWKAVVIGKTPHGAISQGKPGWIYEGFVSVGVGARI